MSCHVEDNKLDMRSGFFYKKSEKSKNVLNKPIGIINNTSIGADNVIETNNLTSSNRTMEGEKISNASNIIKDETSSNKKEISRDSVSERCYDELFISLASFMDMVFIYSSYAEEYLTNSNIEIASLKEHYMTKKFIIGRLKFYEDLSKDGKSKDKIVSLFDDNENSFKEFVENCKVIYHDMLSIHKVMIQIFINLKDYSSKLLFQDLGGRLFFDSYKDFDTMYKEALYIIEKNEKNSESSSIVSKRELEDNMDLSILDNQNIVSEKPSFMKKEAENISNIEKPFSPKMPEYNRKNRVYAFFSSKDKKHEQSLKKEKSFEELKQRANSMEVSNRVKKSAAVHKKTYELKYQLFNLCKGKKGSAETLQLVLLDERFPEIKKIESNNEVIKIYLSNDVIISTDKGHKHSALITFESRLAEEIMKIRIGAHNDN